MTRKKIGLAFTRFEHRCCFYSQKQEEAQKREAREYEEYKQALQAAKQRAEERRKKLESEGQKDASGKVR